MIQKWKLNFWQILGLILVLLGIAFIISRETGVRPATPIEPVAPAPTVQVPATRAAT